MSAAAEHAANRAFWDKLGSARPGRLVSFDPRSGAVDQERDGRWRLRVDGQALPALFTLRAVRPE